MSRPACILPPRPDARSPYRLHLLAAIALLLVACGSPAQPSVRSAAVATTTPFSASPVAQITTTQSPATVAAAVKHIFVIVMENKEDTQVLGNPDAPYLNALAARSAVADRYYAVSHPSLPNYLALVGGDTFGVTDDCTDCFQDAPNLAGALEAKGLTWKGYQEDLPAPCYTRANTQGYAMKHDPFMYFRDIRDNPARCGNVVPLTQLATDLAGGAVPNFSFITPNLVHDTHDASVAVGDRWLAGFVPTLLDSDAFRDGGLLLITWDEGSSDAGCCGLAKGGGQVALLATTPDGPAGYHSAAPADHYSLLRTIEAVWGLEYLGHSGDAGVAPLCDLLPQRVACSP